MDERLSTEQAGEARTARYMALERQRNELRRERDRVLLRIVGTLGSSAAASALGLRDEDVGRLLGDARERLEAQGDELASAPHAAVTARRGSRIAPQRSDRWADADDWYASLGAA